MGKKNQSAATSVAGLNSYQFASELPEPAVLRKNISVAIAEYEERRRQDKSIRRATVADISDVEAALQLADSVLQALSTQRQAPSGDAYEQRQFFKKQVATLSRALDTDNTKIVPFGGKTISLIHIISLLVVQELDDLSRTNPIQYKKYTSGEDRTYWFKTTTQSLCTILNKNKVRWEVANGTSNQRRTDKDFQNLCASFRGADGFYRCMEAAGFLTEKVNLDRFLNDHEDGRDVRLGVNLEWLFAFSANIFTQELAKLEAVKTAEIQSITPQNAFFGDLQSGNSSHLGINLSYGYKETEYNENGAAKPQSSSAPEGAQEKNKASEEERTPTPNDQEKKVKNTGGAAFFVEKDEKNDAEILMNCANDSAKRAMKALFNRKNVENGRIRFNGNSKVAELTPQDLRDIAHWTADVYRAIRKDGESWIEVAKLVNEAIENTEQYLGEHPTRWLYHPKFWFNPTFTGGALINYLNDYLSRPTYQKAEKEAAKSLDFGDYSPQIAWFLENGANRDALKFQIRRIGAEAVSDCIALGGAKMFGGQFVPKNGKVAYIFGIIKGCKPELIHSQAEIAKAKALGKPAKPAPIWTPERVRSAMEKAVKNIIWRELITEQMITKVADKFAYMNASEAQIGDIFYQYCFQNHEKLGAI